MKSCRTWGTKLHLKVCPSSVQSRYKTPLSLIKIFWTSTSLCNFLAISLQYISFFCSSCNCLDFNGKAIFLMSLCSVILTQISFCKFCDCSLDSLLSMRLCFFNGFLSYLSSNVSSSLDTHEFCECLLNSLPSACVLAFSFLLSATQLLLPSILHNFRYFCEQSTFLLILTSDSIISVDTTSSIFVGSSSLKQ